MFCGFLLLKQKKFMAPALHNELLGLQDTT